MDYERAYVQAVIRARKRNSPELSRPLVRVNEDIQTVHNQTSPGGRSSCAGTGFCAMVIWAVTGG